ncbi:hypothetical protein AT00_17065 [Pseudoalteromonas lipolytica SCSIO 04301]|uniref:YjbH domain-containing protein n=1 Tax=Pseudoalteromonas lipolytica TaxID=570156 RepID=UPI00044B6B01|nr:YjbH domain-containing protein [Pseudoalteromonas lipolytica]EWH04585.1 hypothetical protein AT00_17065 [Pseudoalteromonas lipolytica SCSIO 04301]
MLKANTLIFGGVATLCAPALAADEITAYQSFAGYSGLINTPNASVLDKGMIDIGYNNQLDFNGLQYVNGHNYIFSAGLFDGLEVSGQIASNSMHDNLFYSEGRGQIRDLSFNAKYQLPLIPAEWFSVALGAKDIGGAANKYETYYAVASKELWDFRFSAGYSVSDRLSGQMDGPFAGVEWQPFDWFALQAEHDADAFNAAARVTIPKKWLYDIGTLTFTSRFYSNSDFAEDDTYWGVNFSLPLSPRAAKIQKLEAAPVTATPTAKQTIITDSAPKNSTLQNSSHKQVAYKPVTTLPAQVTKPEHLHNKKQMNNEALSLKRALSNDGFENILVGYNKQNQLVVKFENAVFNQNDLDALGLVLGRVAEHIEDQNTEFYVQLEKYEIPQFHVIGKVSNYNAFLNNNASPDLQVNLGAMSMPAGLSWIGLTSANSPYFKPRVTLSPALTSSHATELGVLDYSLALRADVDIPLWKGAGISLGGQVHVTDSDDFEENAPFKHYREESDFDRAMLYQTFALPWGFYNQTQLGYMKDRYDFMGVRNETGWLSPEGRHKVTADFGYFEYQDYDLTKEYQTLSYQFNWVEQDITLHATAGNFWYEDSGARVESRFWFGDSYLAVYLEDTNVQKVGLAFSIPLSPRKDMAVSKYGQVKGTNAWRHAVSTQIGESKNVLVFNQAYVPAKAVNLDNAWFNQGRMSTQYVYSNLTRLKEVYSQYR